MLHDPKQRRLRKRLAAGSLEFAVEPLSKIASELPPLIARFGETHAPLPPDPDWRQLLNLAAGGGLVFVTARSNSELVGFAMANVGPHVLYHTTKHGWITAIWLEPEYRGGLNGYRLLLTIIETLKNLGCKRLYVWRQIGDRRLHKLFGRLGFRMEEVAYSNG